MQKRIGLAGILCVVLGASAAAQTNVTTTGGTTNSVPVFTGSATVGNSNIFQSGSNVGIGTTNPVNILEVAGDYNGSTDGWAADGGAGQITVHGVTNPTLAFGIGVDTSNQVVRLQGQMIGAGPLPIVLNPMGGGRVGIGTLYPQNFLEVVGDYYGQNDGWPADTGAGQFTIHGATNPNLALGIGLDTTLNAVRFQGQLIGTGPLPILLNPMAGNVGIGTTTPSASLEVNGSVKLTAGSGAKMTFQDGSVQSVAWNGVLSGGDYAESVDVIGDRKAYEPGDVLVIDPTVEGKFLKSSQPYSTNVLGVYSTKPGVVGRRQTSDRSHMAEEVPMAMVGVIPTKVCAEGGPIKPGDLLVTSSTPGYAMKGTDRTQMLGAIIGKALGHLDVGTGVMEVGVSIQ